MLNKIILNKNLPLKKRLKNTFAYLSRRRGAKYGWGRRFKRVFEINPDYREPVAREIERNHSAIWQSFSKHVNLATLRLCANISGKADPYVIPEEVYVADIEPTLNRHNAADFLANKSFYEIWFPNGNFPRCFFHKVNGDLFDGELKKISFSEVKKIINCLSFPVVFKPNIESYGGVDIHFPSEIEELLDLVVSMDDFVVQEKIDQHLFFEKFNHSGLNTIRAYVYKSVQDNSAHVINVVLRMGVGGSLDNETAGGILTLIREDGALNGYAVDKNGKRFVTHPDSGCAFEGVIPDFLGLIGLSKRIAERVFYARLIGLDLCLDKDGDWRLIEVNTSGAATRLAQYHGERFFGKYTDEVIEYCKKHHWALT